ncbi:protein IL-40 isoform X1 [Halichoerus grypus]|uniref:protein IL-40 isoform X1 n=1 Tax=Halichoerus grypus TaxID=9711 RepID=UPI001659A574|nr:protein IL-40 isoform X1 [Halichoerus grypus]
MLWPQKSFCERRHLLSPSLPSVLGRRLSGWSPASPPPWAPCLLPSQPPPTSRHQRLLCAAGEVTPETFIAYKVLEVFPRGRRVAITCHSPQAPPPITYSLWGSQGTEVAKKVVKTRDLASFSINITLKSRPDLLTYSCKAASPWGEHSASTKLQMYWELWTKPVSQLQATFTLLDRGSGPRVEISCRVSSGSPPITYRLVGKDGSVHMQQRPSYGQPADFSFALPNMSTWLQCQAENDLSVQSSPFKLVPPAAPGGHRGAGWQPHLHCRCHLLVAGPGLVDQAVTRRGRLGRVLSGGPWSLSTTERTHHLREEKPASPDSWNLVLP